MGRRKLQPLGGYELAFDSGIRVEIAANDRADAFVRAQKLVTDERSATLYEDGVALGRLSYSAAGFWTVSPKGDAAA